MGEEIEHEQAIRRLIDHYISPATQELLRPLEEAVKKYSLNDAQRLTVDTFREGFVALRFIPQSGTFNTSSYVEFLFDIILYRAKRESNPLIPEIAQIYKKYYRDFFSEDFRIFVLGNERFKFSHAFSLLRNKGNILISVAAP